MATTTSTFYLYADAKSSQFPSTNYTLTAKNALTTFPVVFSDLDDTLLMTPQGISHYFSNDAEDYYNLEDLRRGMSEMIGKYGYFVSVGTDNKLVITAPFPFTMDTSASKSSAAVKLGFVDTLVTTGTGTIAATSLGKNPITSLTVECPWYPPSTISDENVFMTMVGAATNAYEIAPLNTMNPVPYMISILNLPQPCGTASTSFTTDCLRGTEVGIVITNTSFAKGHSVLTHIPDGLQVLRFRIDQLTDYRSELIVPGLTFAITLQFDVAGTR
jgi:hypothetical protein